MRKKAVRELWSSNYLCLHSRHIGGLHRSVMSEPKSEEGLLNEYSAQPNGGYRFIVRSNDKPKSWRERAPGGVAGHVFNLTISPRHTFSDGHARGLVTISAMPLKSPTRQRRKGPPPGETGQESLYLRFLSEKQVPVTVKLRDGEAVYGWIEYFDDRMIRLTREGKPNLFIYKHQIRTISESHRSIDARRRERNRSVGG